jgi:hypothetical protein
VNWLIGFAIAWEVVGAFGLLWFMSDGTEEPLTFSEWCLFPFLAALMTAAMLFALADNILRGRWRK